MGLGFGVCKVFGGGLQWFRMVEVVLGGQCDWSKAVQRGLVMITYWVKDGQQRAMEEPSHRTTGDREAEYVLPVCR